MKRSHRPTRKPFVLFYDGSCGLCRQIARFIAWLPLRAPIHLVDAANPRQLSHYPQLSPHQAMQSVHLLAPDGRLYRGYDAIVVLIRLTPFLRFFAPLFNTRIARRIGWAFYEWVTNHRHQISHVLALE